MKNKISAYPYFDISLVQTPELADISGGFMGMGKKGCLVILKKEDNHLNNHSFIKKVLHSVGLSTEEDCFLWEVENTDGVLIGPELRNHKIRSMISFGFSPENLGLNLKIQKYQIASLESQKILFADSLSDIESEKNLKVMLWNALKTLFEK